MKNYRNLSYKGVEKFGFHIQLTFVFVHLKICAFLMNFHFHDENSIQKIQKILLFYLHLSEIRNLKSKKYYICKINK